ncbi:MAG TPA: hypothetical protein VEC19_14775 [Usitatibacter sp.]|nr:hypothetical protein [Usitatibacter sp.]
MSESPEDKAMATVRRAEQMIAEVTRQMEEGDEFFRANGLDRSKVNAYCEKSMSAEDRRKAEELISQDLAAIEDEVQQARLHMDDSGGAAKAKRPRSMV